MHEFPGPQDRIRRVLANALVDCTFVSSHPEEGGRSLVLVTRRNDGRTVGIRFRGVREDTRADSASRQPEAGTALGLRSVKREGGSLLARLLPIIKPPGQAYARVRIDAGPATLDIVCQDAEWWEE